MSRSLLLGASILAALTFACGDDGAGAGGDGTTTASTGASSGTPATSTTATSTTASATTSTTASASDSASSTSSGMMVCVPAAQEPCYTGPAGTEGVGTCVGGVATCLPDGSGLGACEGEVTPSFESCALDANCDGTAAPPCNVLFQNQYVASGDDLITAVAVDPAGNVFFAGAFQGTITLGTVLSSTGSYNVFLAKADPTGNVLWAKSLPGDTIASPQALATDPDGNVVLLGRFTGVIDAGGGPFSVGGDESSFVAKYDASGNHIFSHVYNDLSFPPVWSMAVDGAGAILFGGFFTVPIDFGGGVMTPAGLDDAYVVKLDADGNFLWSKQFGDANGQALFGVAVDGNDNVYATGTFLGAVDFGLGVRTAVGADVFVVALDATGAPLWDFVGGGAGMQYADRIAVDSAGEVVVAATFESTIDVGGGLLGNAPLALFKLDATGAHRWSKTFAGPFGSTFTMNLAIGPQHDIFWTGRYSDTMHFGGAPVANHGSYDTWLVHFDENGVHRSSQGFGLDAFQTCGGLAIDAAGRAVLGCGNEGRVDFGAGVLQAATPSDSVLASVLVP